MGALHAGHLSLIRRARRENDFCGVSIFVNPLQFGRAEDYRRYPRDPAGDIRLLRREKVDFLFMPPAKVLVPAGFSTQVTVKGLSEPLCGRFRPGHFTGVATVVLKLLNLCRPTKAYFGLKDYQQFLVVRRMVRDLNVPVKIVACPTVRERDGLACSSRNRMLSPEDRRRAAAFALALADGARALARNGRPAAKILRRLRADLRRHADSLDYLVLCDPATLRPIRTGKGLLAAAVRIGGVRLIDNRRV